ncbi:MAG: adenylyltransferase/cytidyltransferase family protein [Buchnera aphidicola (Meitanaphis microgallis)]
MIVKAIYPGTFDPITYGHLSVISKATKVFNFIVIAIFDNQKKNHY